MATDTNKIDDAVLALLYLTLHDQSHASTSFAPEVLRRLHESGMIEDPAGSSDSVELTADGLQRSKTLFNSMFAAPSAEAPRRLPPGRRNIPPYQSIWPISAARCGRSCGASATP